MIFNLAGNWGLWTSWSTCSATCGTGQQTRSRLCNNPPPTNGGEFCMGSNQDQQTCLAPSCPAGMSYFKMLLTNSTRVLPVNQTVMIFQPHKKNRFQND